MILDPDMNGCTVWQGMYVTHIKGNPEQVCNILYPKITEEVSDTIVKQVYNIGVDIFGIGRVYMDILESMGLNVYPLEAIQINKMLVDRNPNKKEITVKPIFSLEYETQFK